LIALDDLIISGPGSRLVFSVAVVIGVCRFIRL
jgi:hypothetical protein